MTAARTGNGWPVLEPGSRLLGVFTIPGANRRLTLRGGQVAMVLLHFVTWYDRNVERLDAPGKDAVDEGAYNHRPIAGTDSWSEHAAGDAVDLNWQRHPSGTPIRSTFTDKQIRKIRRRIRWMNLLAGGTVIEWGGEWPSHPGSRTPTDGMHYQLRRGRVLLLARILAKTPIGREVRKANPDLKF